MSTEKMTETERPPIVPMNVNPLYADKFKFVLHEAKNVEFFCFKANLPGISFDPKVIHNPSNYFSVGATKLYYEDLILSFRVSEDLTNYKEIFNWMVGITAPQNTDQFKDFEAKRLNVTERYNVTSDGTLFSLTNSSNPNVNITFRNMMPISLTGIDMNTTEKGTVSATVAFKYDWYQFI